MTLARRLSAHLPAVRNPAAATAAIDTRAPPRDIPDRDKWMEAIEAARTGHGGTSVAADLTISGLGYDVESPASKVVLPLLICTRTSTRTSMSKCSVPVRAPSD